MIPPNTTLWARAGIAVLLLIGAVVLVGGAARGVSSTRKVLDSEHQHSARQVQRFIDCVVHELETRVPAGARVFFAVQTGLPRERMIEGTYPRYRVVDNPNDADYIVDIDDVSYVEDRVVPTVGCGTFRVTGPA